jgi:hypothetical protein
MNTELDRYAVGWGALALLNANIAQLKGRSGLWWFFGSLFGGPLVTFLLTFVEPKAPGPPGAP